MLDYFQEALYKEEYCQLAFQALQMIAAGEKKPHNQEAGCGVRIKKFSCGYAYISKRQANKFQPVKIGKVPKTRFLFLIAWWKDVWYVPNFAT